MLKKEFIDSIRIFGYCMFLFLVIPIARLMDVQVLHTGWEISGIWQPVYIAVTLIFAAYSGVSIFQSERKDGALEYLLSLPVSRWKILTSKVFPRFILLLLLVIVGRVFSIFDNILIDGAGILILFLSAIFISLAVDSTANGLIGVLLLNFTLYYTSLILSYLTIEHRFLGSDAPICLISHILPVVLLLVPLAAAFGKTLKNVDVKPLKWQAKPYLLIALPTVMVLLSFILMFFKGYLQWIKEVLT